MYQITVWPEGSTWIVSRDDESSDTIKVFTDEDEALKFGRMVADREGLPLFKQDEHCVSVEVI